MEIPVRIYEEITGLAELPPPVDEADYERRKHRRIPFGHKAIISPERKGYDNTPAVVILRDVSLGGVSFLNDEALKVGTPILIEFKGHQDRPVQLHCAVVRCEAGGSGGAQFVVGASFDAVLTKELPVEAPVQTPKLAELAAQELKHAAAAPVAAVPSMTLTDETAPVEDQTRIAEKLKKTETAPQAAAPVPAAPAPVKSSALFKAADPTEAKPVSEEYWSEGQQTDVAPQPAAAKAAPELATPVFRDVPLPDPEPEPERKPEPEPELEEEAEPEPGSEIGTEPEPVIEIPKKVEIQEKEIPEKEVPKKVVPAAAEPVRQSHEHHGKTHEVLARVKELLVVQEQSIERQRQELKEQRERFEKEIKLMRSELEDTKAKLAEVRTKSDEDEDAIAELENFLEEHDRRDPPERKNEAA